MKTIRRKRTRRPSHLCYLSLDYGIDPAGHKGASVHLRSICGALASLGQEVRIRCSRCENNLLQIGGRAMSVVTHPLPKDLLKFRRSLREVYQSKIGIPAEVRQCAINRDALNGLRTAWTRTRPRAVIERMSLMGVAGGRVAKSLNIPHLLEVNALLSDEAKAHRTLTDYAAAKQAEDETLMMTRRIFVVSSALRAAVIARGIEPEKIEVLPNGYDENLFRPQSGKAARKRLRLGDRFCIGLVGSMKGWHGIETLLEAFRRFATSRKDIALILVGEGPEMQSIADFQKRHPALTVIATGPIPHAKVPEIIGAFDVAVAPYERINDFYFSPMKVCEYMAMGKPVVASNQGQICELIAHKESGLLFEAGNAGSLRNCFALLHKNPALRSRLGRAARKAIQGKTWSANAQRLLAVVEEGQN